MLVADKYQQGVDLMRSKVLLILMIVIPVTVFFVFGAAAGIYCIINRSTDEVPDSSSLYVYAVDREFGELNQRYAKARGIEPIDDTALITYETVPDISQMDGVKSLFIFDDAAFSEFCERINSGETLKAAVPYDAYVFYGDPSGMRSVFGIEIPHDARLPNSKYVVFRISKEKVEQVSEEPDYFLYYEYDPETWEEFNKKLHDYLVKDDATSDVSMLITTKNKSDASNLQMELMYYYPASNYCSAEFTKAWVGSYNNEIKGRILVAGLITAIPLAGIEILLGTLRKPRKKAG